MEGYAHDLESIERTEDVKIKTVSPFSKMILSESVRKGLQEACYVYPTNIQATAIPLGKSGLDLLVQSKSGTGKTLIFCTILLENYQSNVKEPQAIIVVPTREIAVQIDDILNKIGRFCEGFRAVHVIGGLDVADDRRRLQGAKAVVGTPGRILHLISNDVLNTSQIRLFVLDEADKMYSPSFRQDLTKIRHVLPGKRQTIACSATFCNDLDKELAKTMQNPLLISTESRATVLVGIKQFAYELPEQKSSILEMTDKLDAIRYIFGKIPFKQCIAFARSQSRADSYRNYLEREGWPCEMLTGAQDQKTRLEIFKRFREFNIRILLATDLMARGIDSENVNLVINLELPTDVITYLHRIGRAGRFGSHGIAISFIASEKDRHNFTRLIAAVGSGMNVLKFPKCDTTAHRDFWDFSDYGAEEKLYGCFGGIAPLASEDNSIGITNTDLAVENNCSSSIDTKTFQVDSRDSALNLVDLQMLDFNENNMPNLTAGSRQSSSQQLPSSNTIDDASSIAADSDNLQGSQLDISRTTNAYKSILMQKAAIPTLVEFLVDQEFEKAKNEQIDLFDDYRHALDQSGGPEQANESKTEQQQDVKLTASKLSNFKDMLIDEPKPSNPQTTAPKKDIYSDYDNFNGEDDSISCAETLSQNTYAEEIDKATFILSVATPSPRASIEELDNSIIDISQQSILDTQSPPEVQHFPSPANINPPAQIPDVAAADCSAVLPFISKEHRYQSGCNALAAPEEPPEPNMSPNDSESNSSVNDQSNYSSNAERMSSGFDEKPSTSGSSGIETSEEDENSHQDDSTLSGSYGETGDDDEYEEFCLEEEETEDNENYVGADEDLDFEEEEEDYENSDEDVEDNDEIFKQKISMNGEVNETIEEHIASESTYSTAHTAAYAHWLQLYKNQIDIIQNYVNCCKNAQVTL